MAENISLANEPIKFSKRPHPANTTSTNCFKIPVQIASIPTDPTYTKFLILHIPKKPTDYTR